MLSLIKMEKQNKDILNKAFLKLLLLFFHSASLCRLDWPGSCYTAPAGPGLTDPLASGLNVCTTTLHLNGLFLKLGLMM